MLRRLVQLLVGAAVLGGCLTGSASEKIEPGRDVSIESAKREFDTLQEASGVTPGSSLRLPQIQSPQLRMTEETPETMVSTPRDSREEIRRKEKSENWLLEAMLEQPEADTEVDTLKKEQEKLRANPFEQMIAEQLRPADQDEEPAPDDADGVKEQVVNPLSAFMASWVSDQDRELLLPDKTQRMGEPWLGQVEVSASVTTIKAETTFRDIPVEEGRGFDRIADGVDANPYLKVAPSIVVEPVERAPSSITPQLDVKPADRPNADQVLPPRSPPTVTSPGNRDAEAKKYFPQLKRF